jgi:hypothetical protein
MLRAARRSRSASASFLELADAASWRRCRWRRRRSSPASPPARLTRWSSGWSCGLPALIALPAGVNDVGRVIAFARDHDLLLAVRTAGGPARLATVPSCDARAEARADDARAEAAARVVARRAGGASARAEVVRAIASARGFGDLSENFEYTLRRTSRRCSSAGSGRSATG